MNSQIIQQKLFEKMLREMEVGNRKVSDIYYEFFFEVKEELAAQPLTIAIDSKFAERLIPALTADQREDLAFLCGPRIDGVFQMSGIQKCNDTHRSLVKAELDVGATVRSFVSLRNEGYECPLIGHSHPGKGANCTHPSATDMDWISDLQAGGAQVIGVIVSRDGYMRFFTDKVPFKIITFGNRIIQDDQNVYRLLP